MQENGKQMGSISPDRGNHETPQSVAEASQALEAVYSKFGGSSGQLVQLSQVKGLLSAEAAVLRAGPQSDQAEAEAARLEEMATLKDRTISRKAALYLKETAAVHWGNVALGSSDLNEEKEATRRQVACLRAVEVVVREKLTTRSSSSRGRRRPSPPRRAS